ncbi:zinc-binding dehydrogenase [Garciella nitratireducens]|uniref:zinc-binding dehydrogenase n=1 Tax=Garciella nitratireducens TaxID=218205 RepID=UPI001BD3498B|nr:zinc-binding dehydrogenase [Garciella nitratireducens]
MKTRAIRIYGKEDLRLEEFLLPEIKEDEILASVVTDSICMSTYKFAKQGELHKRAPKNMAQNPPIVGHEMCGEILKVGKKWKERYKEGTKYVLQVNLPDQVETPGYSYPYVGGDATYIVLPNEIMEKDCLLEYYGETFFEGSLVEPLSCVISSFKANYHLCEHSKAHKMGIQEGGSMLLMGATGPMGLLAVDLAIHGPKRPKKLVVTDIDQNKIDKARERYCSEEVEVYFVNTKGVKDLEKLLRSYVDAKGYDDIFVFAPVSQLVTLGSNLLNPDGCLNFFAGPSDKELMAEINIYDIHYNAHHYVGISGGDTQDMKDAIKLIEEKKVDVSKVVTHVLGLDQVPQVTLEQAKIGGGKKIVYTHKEFPLWSLEDVTVGKEGDFQLSKILRKNDGIWSKEAEEYLLSR